jgi:hypothetical protein
MRASGINRAFMQARSLSAGPVIAASSASGMPLGSDGNAQLASGACACAIVLPARRPESSLKIVPAAFVKKTLTLNIVLS